MDSFNIMSMRLTSPEGNKGKELLFQVGVQDICIVLVP